MISFRYHVVSLVAVILALAVGIVVGATALNGPITNDLRHQVDGLKKDRAHLTGTVRSLQGQVDTAGQFATTFGPQLVAGVLKDAPVLVVALPGTPKAMLDGVGSELTAAGAKLTGRLELARTFVDPTQGDSITNLAIGSHPLGLTLPQTSDARVLGASMLGYVLTGNGQATDLNAVLGGFAGLHMISSGGSSDSSAVSAIQPAKNVVVVGSGDNRRNDYAGQAEIDLVSQLAGHGGKVVVAGDTASAGANGVVGLVRGGPSTSTVSTVDDADSAFGQVSTVLAVAGAINSQVGHYGTAQGAQALYPTPPK